MREKITYYAIIDEDTSREKPRAVLRRVETDEGRTDELFSRDLKWELSPLLYPAEHGDTMFDFTEITREEADQIVDRIRGDGDGPTWRALGADDAAQDACRETYVAGMIRTTYVSAPSRCQKNPRFGRSLAAASMISAAVWSVSAASAPFACSVG